MTWFRRIMIRRALLRLSIPLPWLVPAVVLALAGWCGEGTTPASGPAPASDALAGAARIRSENAFKSAAGAPAGPAGEAGEIWRRLAGGRISESCKKGWTTTFLDGKEGACNGQS